MKFDEHELDALAVALAPKVVEALRPFLARPPAKIEETLLNVEALSKYIGAPRCWIYNQVHLRAIPFKKMGKRHVRFRKSEIDRWLEEKAVKPR